MPAFPAANRKMPKITGQEGAAGGMTAEAIVRTTARAGGIIAATGSIPIRQYR